MEVDDVDLSTNLLADTFGVWECRSAGDFKVRVTNNFRANTANEYAWMPSKLTYNGFSELKDALSAMKSVWSGELELGKSDFQAAFKTLPAAEGQGWLCWALIYNTDEERHQVVPVQSQSFGSLGAVVAWHRTSCLLQTLMQSLFGLVVFSYVDDFFWVAPVDPISGVGAGWLQGFFRRVVSGLLGWQLDPSKDSYGSSVVLLGLEITSKLKLRAGASAPRKPKNGLRI